MSQRLSMLFLSTRFLFPSDSGGKIRTRDVLRGLKGGRFKITLVSPQPTDATAYASELEQVCDRFVGWPDPSWGYRHSIWRLMALLSTKPVSVATDRSAAGTRLVADELGGGHDLVVIDFPHAAILLPGRVSIPTIVFTHNVESEIYQRQAEVTGTLFKFLLRDQYRKMLRYERTVLGLCDEVIVVSKRDQEFFVTEFGLDHVSEIPTGVDLDEFAYRPPGEAYSGQGPEALVFVGSMDWRGNIDAITYFMDDVWPLIAARRKDLEFLIVGRNPPPDLARRARDRHLPWTITGFVDDVRHYVYRSLVYVIPLRVGSGSRIKAYQAMALGCPVVSTTIGIEGLPLVPDEHYLLADSPSDFAEAILRLVDNPGMRQTLSERAYRFIADRFSAVRVAQEFERICLETVDRVGQRQRH